MTDSPDIDEQQAADQATVDGGGMAAAEDPTMVAVRKAAQRLELLSEETRESVLGKMDPAVAGRIRDYLASMPDRPHGQFSQDVADRRRMLHETANRITARKTAETERELGNLEQAIATPTHGGTGTDGQAATGASTAGIPEDPLDRLRELHPAAIARAMQGERAEAWAIVLDRLDDNARAALQLYLDAAARTAIDDARARQAELAQSAPALLATIVAAIARTVVPRAMREHHQLLSTTPLAWTGQLA